MSERFYQSIAPWYDLEFSAHDRDLELYLGYAGIVGGPILEPACGTGRLLAPLAEAGYEITGIDSSPAMVERARARLARAGLTAAVDVGDMRDLSHFSEGQFRLVFIALNSFLHLATRADQVATLRSCARLLRHDGLFILDVFHPTPATLQSMDDRFTLDGDWPLPDGSRVERFSQHRVRPAEQRVDTVLLYDHVSAGGEVRRTVASYAMRYVHRFELEGLCDDAGLEIEGVYGDYTLDPLDDTSPQLILVAHRR